MGESLNQRCKKKKVLTKGKKLREGKYFNKKMIVLEKGEGKGRKYNGKGTEQRCVALHSPPYCFVAFSHRFYHRAPRSRRNGSNGRMHVLFPRFSPHLLLSHLSNLRKKKGNAVSQAARVSPPLYLSLLFFCLLFYLRSKTRQETYGEDKRGTKKKRRGARLQV